MVKQKDTLDTTVDQKNLIAQFLLQCTIEGNLPFGSKKKAATTFGVSYMTVRRIWAAAMEQVAKGEPIQFKSNKKGKQHADLLLIDEAKFRSLSVLERTTIRKMASKLEVSKSLVGVWIKQGKLRPHTNAIKSQLSEANKIARMKWSLSQLRLDNNLDKMFYNSMQNVVHIDEKWFYMTKASDRYYLLPDKIEPYRSIQSKRFINKVMFMCAVSRPHFDSNGELLFDGKYGIFPFTTQVAAQRNSKNRVRGTLETKPINSVNKEIMKDCIINQIVPAIKAKWPASSCKDIIIQQDNAKPHIMPNDQEFKEAANTDGFNIKIVCQPPNSPDTNVNDLCFFRAIQSLQDDKSTKNVDDLLKNVVASFDELSPHTLDSVFLTLQSCLTEILRVKGGNNYKIPHMNKQRLRNLGLLPMFLEVDKDLIRDSLNYLLLPENDAGADIDLSFLNDYFQI
ncbi:uncharacterized protein LOC121745970 [Salvia splendens]|uniref:uncharacterized protein LOC121745970 n=1 Tax=Salvia splendens TaxID=180675 RepID=UPI001C254FBA|nr:uncharacterized protein LOC121745970 [Salvia splendens]